jgi:hypothetical protein
MGYVYLLMSTDSDGLKELFKIGITKSDIQKRIKSLSTGNPNKITLIDHYESKNYLRIEKWLHATYNLKKTESENEWFCLEESDVKSFQNNCKKADSNITLLLNENPFFK